MKKLYSSIIIFGILILISNSVFASEFWNNKENKKKEDAFKLAVSTYMDTFLTEETPEEDRITGYEMTGYGFSEPDEDENKMHVSITVDVDPVNENNTTWSSYRNHCFADFTKVNGEYVLDKISRYPDNYDKFLERFDEYKNTIQESSETVIIQGEKQDNLAAKEIRNINNGVVIACACLFVISGITMVKIIINKIKK